MKVACHKPKTKSCLSTVEEVLLAQNLALFLGSPCQGGESLGKRLHRSLIQLHMYPCHMTMPDLLCECTYEQGTNHNLWFGGVPKFPLHKCKKSEAIETEYDDILLRVRNKSREKILGSSWDSSLLKLIVGVTKTQRKGLRT